MSRIFLSYRRSESGDAAGRLFDRLESAFGREAVFKDVDSIPLGADFRQSLEMVVNQCEVALVLIGDQWASLRDEEGRKRLELENDYVRKEVSAVLSRKIRVIPVLLGEAKMPEPEELPESIRDLAFLQAFRLHRDPLFNRDVADLIGHLTVDPVPSIGASAIAPNEVGNQSAAQPEDRTEGSSKRQSFTRRRATVLSVLLSLGFLAGLASWIVWGRSERWVALPVHPIDDEALLKQTERNLIQEFGSVSQDKLRAGSEEL